MTIHNEENNDYLGYYISAGDTVSYLVADSLISLVARNLTSTRETFQFEDTEFWDISFLNPNFYLSINDSANIDGAIYNNSDITLSWELGSSTSNVMYQLQNAEYAPYANLNFSDSIFKSIDYELSLIHI